MKFMSQQYYYINNIVFNIASQRTSLFVNETANTVAIRAITIRIIIM